MQPLQLNAFSKIVIVGTSGSGKTTLARILAQKYQIPDIELDALYWEPEWTPASDEDFQTRVRNATAERGWIVHGNYSKVRDMIWNKADVIIWLDYPRYLVMWRVLRRTIHRVFTQQKICGDNTESFRISFLSKDSVILWAHNTFKRNRLAYGELMRDSEYGAKMIRVRTPREAEDLVSR